jgi:hypothetical protein
MIFNFWRPAKWFKPKKSGWYTCTAAHGGGLDTPRVMDLYFRDWDSKWIDPRRQTVFDGYKVYEACRAPIEDNRVFTDSDCERIDILAWKKIPRCYGWWRKRGNSNE